MSRYVSDFKNWDLAIVTLKEPVGLKAGWMGIKALPPRGFCFPGATTLPNLQAVGYPVENASSSYQYVSSCSLEVCLQLCSVFPCTGNNLPAGFGEGQA
jgi:hypothetical protein